MEKKHKTVTTLVPNWPTRCSMLHLLQPTSRGHHSHSLVFCPQLLPNKAVMYWEGKKGQQCRHPLTVEMSQFIELSWILGRCQRVASGWHTTCRLLDLKHHIHQTYVLMSALLCLRQSAGMKVSSVGLCVLEAIICRYGLAASPQPYFEGLTKSIGPNPRGGINHPALVGYWYCDLRRMKAGWDREDVDADGWTCGTRKDALRGVPRGPHLARESCRWVSSLHHKDHVPECQEPPDESKSIFLSNSWWTAKHVSIFTERERERGTGSCWEGCAMWGKPTRLRHKKGISGMANGIRKVTYWISLQQERFSCTSWCQDARRTKTQQIVTHTHIHIYTPS